MPRGAGSNRRTTGAEDPVQLQTALQVSRSDSSYPKHQLLKFTVSVANPRWGSLTGYKGRLSRQRFHPGYLICRGTHMALAMAETRLTVWPVPDFTGSKSSSGYQLKILQQQLESFKTLRQQILENVNMVQSEISEILNKNIIEMKTPQCSSDKILMISTPNDVSLPAENPESPFSKKKVHHDQQPCTDEHVEANSHTGNTVSDIKISHSISLKTIAAGKVENSEDLMGNTTILALKNEYKRHLLPGTELETGSLNAAHEKVILNESKLSILSPQNGKEFYVTDNINYPNKSLKQEFQNPVISLKEKGLHFDQEFYEDSKCVNTWSSSITICNEQAESESKNEHKEFRSNYSKGDSFQVNFFSKMVKDELIMVDHKEHLEKEQQLNIINQTLLRFEDQKFGEIKVACEYDEKTEVLQKSLKNSEHLQNRVHDLENKNLALKNKLKPLNITIQSLKGKISKYNKQIQDLAEEKKRIQSQLVKSEDGSKEHIKEIKKLLRKCKELQNQTKILEEDTSQLDNGSQYTIQALQDFQITNQKVEEEMTFVTCEKERLNAMLESLQKECFMLQETNKKLEMDTSELMKEKNSLEGELERNQSEIQQMKEKETATKSELETLLQLMQTLEDKNLNLEITLQECSNTKQMLQKDFEKVQSDKAHMEKKLMTELRNAKADIDLLKSNLTSMDRERERLSMAVTNITEENQLLKKELQEYRQGASKYESDIRKLTEECLLLENHLRTVENERDVLQFEFRHLHKDYAYLRGRATDLVREQRKRGYSSGIRQDNCYSDYSTKICKEISDSKSTALECQSQDSQQQILTQCKWST
ncbi:coiled-coil domain-containing protein 110 [Rhea pennata]|uniref:coiled-coil domain-containing protein 110 n=1 Tax=Rhea pennata TaxID=8795 RepID=UPI002E254759